VRDDRRRTTKIVYRVIICRAAFVVRFLTFAVRPKRMAKARFPVVTISTIEISIGTRTLITLKE
jgi:hypothetical protein